MVEPTSLADADRVLPKLRESSKVVPRHAPTGISGQHHSCFAELLPNPGHTMQGLLRRSPNVQHGPTLYRQRKALLSV